MTTNPVMIVRDQVSDTDAPDGRNVWMGCPGCGGVHHVQIVGVAGERPSHGHCWEWDGNLNSPTFSPSLLVFRSVHLCADDHAPTVCVRPEECPERGHLILNAADGNVPPTEARILGHPTPHTREPAWGNCHSFIRNGQWEFLSDSGHHLAGQTVPMVPLPDWLVR